MPQPAYEICSGAEEAIQAAERIGFPCVIKAPDRQGQRGLTLVRSADEVAEAVRVALDASRTATLLVEEHVPGREVTVNAFSSGGHFYPLTVTDRLDRAAAGFRRRAHPRLAERARPRGDRRGRRGGCGRGGGGRDHRRAELHAGAGRPGRRRASASSPHGSAAATTRSSAASLSASTSTAPRSQRRSAKRSPPTSLAPVARVGGACVRFLVAPPGELREVAGVEEAFGQEGIRGIRIYRRPGHRFEEFRRGADRAGAILAVGDSREEALARAAKRGRHDSIRDRCRSSRLSPRAERPCSASSRRRSARRRSPPSRRRCAPAG